jgi:hypothetical protein
MSRIIRHEFMGSRRGSDHAGQVGAWGIGALGEVRALAGAIPEGGGGKGRRDGGEGRVIPTEDRIEAWRPHLSHWATPQFA